MPQFFDRNGRQIALGKELGSGGEGAVFDIGSHPHHVVKVYHKPVPDEKAAKLSCMATLASEDLTRFAAWPLATVSRQVGGPVAGIVLPKVTGCEEIHNLYSPAARRNKFPSADWSFLCRMAMNTSAAFEILHHRGHIVGDVNQGNLLASHHAVAFLIDCDSFQITANGRTFFCDVGVSHYTPPELQQVKSFHGVVRTSNHDCFGLAILIFHLLFMGRHPYAGRFLGTGEMPLEKAIAEYRYAYSRSAAALQMAPPPQTLNVGKTVPELEVLFERAFSRGSASPDARPSAHEWRVALGGLSNRLQTCGVEPGHKYPRQLASCSWCELMQTGAPDFFISVALAKFQSAGAPTIDLNALWNAIQSVPHPHSLPLRLPLIDYSSLVGAAIPENVADNDFMTKAVGRVAIGAVGILILGPFSLAFVYLSVALTVVFGTWWCVLRYTSGRTGEKRRRNISLKRCHAALDNAHRSWANLRERHEDSFGAELTRLLQAKERHRQLRVEQDAELKEVESRRSQEQLRAYLDAALIRDAQIPNIGQARKAVLASYGIESALDIERSRLNAVPGFGETLTSALLVWRGGVERAFRFNPSAAIPPSEINRLTMKYFQMRCQLEIQLQRGVETLRRFLTVAERELDAAAAGIPDLERAVAQARADLTVLKNS